MSLMRDPLARLVVRDVRAAGLVSAALGAPALVVIPLAGIEPGFQVAIKLVALAAAAVSFVVCMRSGSPAARDAGAPHVEGCLGALAMSAVLSGLLAGAPLVESAPVAATFGAGAILARGARLGLGRRWATIHVTVVAVAMIVAALGFAELLGARFVWAWARRPESTLGNRNALAGFLAMSLPFVLALAARWRRALPAVTLVVLVLVATRCRSAYLACAAASGLTALGAWAHRRRVRRAAAARGPWRRAIPVLCAAAAGVVLGAAPWPGVRFVAPVSDAASRLFEHDRGTGLARITQHLSGFAAIRSEPLAWLTGLGGGSWERVAAGAAHDVAEHAPRFTGAITPNSEILRTFVEQGALGLALVVLVIGLAARSLVAGLARAGDGGARVAPLAALGAASVTALFDPLLVRPECVALVAVIAGAASAGATSLESAPRARRSSRGWLDRAAAAVACAAALVMVARAASFAASSRLGSDVVASPGWDARQALAMRLFPRPSLEEKRATAWADAGRCDEAAAALARFVAVRPHHWGARARIARCFESQGEYARAQGAWRDAFAAEPHLRQLLVALATDPRLELTGHHAHVTTLEPRNPR